jgi:hypothetical protein
LPTIFSTGANVPVDSMSVRTACGTW